MGVAVEREPRMRRVDDSEKTSVATTVPGQTSSLQGVPRIDDRADREVMEEVRAGVTTRFSGLTERHGRHCVQFFLFRCRCPLDIAQDLTQEVFIRVFRSSQTYDGTRPFRPWLMAICRNVAADFQKSEKARRIKTETWIPPIPTGTEQRVVAAVTVQQAVAQLPERQSEIVVMHYFWDLPIKEIAEVLGIQEGTVKSTLFQARQRLLELLGDPEPKSK